MSSSSISALWEMRYNTNNRERATKTEIKSLVLPTTSSSPQPPLASSLLLLLSPVLLGSSTSSFFARTGACRLLSSYSLPSLVSPDFFWRPPVASLFLSSFWSSLYLPRSFPRALSQVSLSIDTCHIYTRIERERYRVCTQPTKERQ